METKKNQRLLQPRPVAIRWERIIEIINGIKESIELTDPWDPR